MTGLSVRQFGPLHHRHEGLEARRAHPQGAAVDGRARGLLRLDLPGVLRSCEEVKSSQVRTHQFSNFEWRFNLSFLQM